MPDRTQYDDEDDYYDDYDDYDDEPERKSRGPIIVVVVIALLLVVVIVGGVMLVNSFNDRVQSDAEASSASRTSQQPYGNGFSPNPLPSTSAPTTTTPTTTAAPTTTPAPTTTTAAPTTTQPPPATTTQAPVPTPPPPAPAPAPAAPAGEPRRLVVCDITSSGGYVSIITELGDSFNWQVAGTVNRYGVYDTMVTTDPNGPRNVTAATQVTTVDARSCPVY